MTTTTTKPLTRSQRDELYSGLSFWATPPEGDTSPPNVRVSNFDEAREYAKKKGRVRL